MKQYKVSLPANLAAWYDELAEQRGVTKSRLLYAAANLYRGYTMLVDYGELMIEPLQVDGRHQPKQDKWYNWLRENRPHLFE